MGPDGVAEQLWEQPMFWEEQVSIARQNNLKKKTYKLFKCNSRIQMLQFICVIFTLLL